MGVSPSEAWDTTWAEYLILLTGKMESMEEEPEEVDGGYADSVEEAERIFRSFETDTY